MDKSTNAVAYAPGYYIRDILTTLNISNEEIAKKLEAFFHVEASRWLTLEKQYRMTKK